MVHDQAREMNMLQFLGRDINKGFSGGEIKRSEVLQLMIQKPDFIMLDEPESGVDLENISLIGTAIGSLLEKDKHIIKRQKSGLIITHTGYILDYLETDRGHVMCDGQIKCHGNPREILQDIKQQRGRPFPGQDQQVLTQAVRRSRLDRGIEDGVEGIGHVHDVDRWECKADRAHHGVD
jgi:Fe-S cluster assembly ATPase SufC